MTHFKVEKVHYATLQTNYPHTPTDSYASLLDYLEDQLSQGWKLVAFSGDIESAGANGTAYVFEAFLR